MCLQKAVEVFALANQIISISGAAEAKKMIAIYCLICPISLIACGFMFTKVLDGISGLALCFSAGVFMYAALSELVPDVFEGENRLSKSTVIVFAAGIFIALFVNDFTVGL